MSTCTSEGKKVCVTGASGYIASWLVKLLLQRGYIVNATVLNLYDPKEVEHLRSLLGAKERLKLFSANLLEEGSFDAAVEGCEGVFHTASPCYFDVKDPQQAELIDPAVKGTLNVLNACAKVPTIKRVVVTSSMAAVRSNGKPLSPEVVVDETWFSDPKFCCESKQWYALSKTLAEQATWKCATEKGIDVVTMHPGMTIGTLLQPTLNTNTAIIADFFSGSETYANTTMTLIHVKDVAMAHILALELPSANGRYCLNESAVHYSEIVKILQELYLKAALPDKCADDNPLIPMYEVSREKMRSLGINCIPLKTSLKETVESLKEKGFITI